VARRLLPDVLPYRTGTAASYGFLGFNGRALADNAPEVMFALVMNAAINSGLRAERETDIRSDRFRTWWRRVRGVRALGPSGLAGGRRGRAVRPAGPGRPGRTGAPLGLARGVERG
jgi:hypothetical protein